MEKVRAILGSRVDHVGSPSGPRGLGVDEEDEFVPVDMIDLSV